jgi:predicted SPOUT superfamily RNA methylase MTH1
MQESSLDYFKHNSVFEGGLDLDTENITSEIISELLEYYEIPHPLDKHISRLEKKIKSAGLKNWINIFMYNEKMNKIQQYQEEELEDYEEERDYDEEEYYDEE